MTTDLRPFIDVFKQHLRERPAHERELFSVVVDPERSLNDRLRYALVLAQQSPEAAELLHSWFQIAAEAHAASVDPTIQ